MQTRDALVEGAIDAAQVLVGVFDQALQGRARGFQLRQGRHKFGFELGAQRHHAVRRVRGALLDRFAQGVGGGAGHFEQPVRRRRDGVGELALLLAEMADDGVGAALDRIGDDHAKLDDLTGEVGAGRGDAGEGLLHLAGGVFQKLMQLVGARAQVLVDGLAGGFQRFVDEARVLCDGLENPRGAVIQRAGASVDGALQFLNAHRQGLVQLVEVARELLFQGRGIQQFADLAHGVANSASHVVGAASKGLRQRLRAGVEAGLDPFHEVLDGVRHILRANGRAQFELVDLFVEQGGCFPGAGAKLLVEFLAFPGDDRLKRGDSFADLGPQTIGLAGDLVGEHVAELLDARLEVDGAR